MFRIYWWMVVAHVIVVHVSAQVQRIGVLGFFMPLGQDLGHVGTGDQDLINQHMF